LPTFVNQQAIPPEALGRYSIDCEWANVAIIGGFGSNFISGSISGGNNSILFCVKFCVKTAIKVKDVIRIRFYQVQESPVVVAVQNDGRQGLHASLLSSAARRLLDLLYNNFSLLKMQFLISFPVTHFSRIIHLACKCAKTMRGGSVVTLPGARGTYLCIYFLILHQ
jgi:hypothetical protein